jgi:CheY-like chemotaxis protein
LNRSWSTETGNSLGFRTRNRGIQVREMLYSVEVKSSCGGARTLLRSRVPDQNVSAEESSPEKILVIEDDADDQAMLIRQLTKSGVQNGVVCVEHGDDAMALVRTGAKKLGEVCAVFLDLSLPGVNGLLLLQAIRSNVETALLPVFIMTGSTNPSDEAEAKRLGATSFIPKSMLSLPSFRTTIAEMFKPGTVLSSKSREKPS